MSAFKGTPGPWSIGQNMADHVYAGINAVAEIYGVPQDTPRDQVKEHHATGLANAALIAQAPNLWAELEAVEPLLSYLADCGNAEAAEACKRIAAVRAALKAGGAL